MALFNIIIIVAVIIIIIIIINIIIIIIIIINFLIIFNIIIIYMLIIVVIFQSNMAYTFIAFSKSGVQTHNGLFPVAWRCFFLWTTSIKRYEEWPERTY